MNIYERIKYICDSKNLSISTVESNANISNGSISKWKNQMPKADNLYSVASFLGVSIEYFLTGETSTQQNESLQNPEQAILFKIYNSLDEKKQHIVLQKALELANEE